MTYFTNNHGKKEKKSNKLIDIRPVTRTEITIEAYNPV
jgi:hypothetical protein